MKSSSHTDEREVRVVVASKDQDAEKLLAAQSKLAKGDKEEARTWISQAEKLVGQIKAAGRKLLPLLVKKKKTAAEATQIGKLKQELEQQHEELKEPLQKIQETIGSTAPWREAASLPALPCIRRAARLRLRWVSPNYHFI